MAKTKKITFWGGFHNMPTISIRVNEDTYEKVRYKVEHESQYQNPYEDLSDYQLKRLDNWFCGIEGCTCGGLFRDVHVEFD